MSPEGGSSGAASDRPGRGARSRIRRFYGRLSRSGFRPGIPDDEGTGNPQLGAMVAPGPHEATGGIHQPALEPLAVQAKLAGHLPQLERLTPSALNALVAAGEQATILRHRAVGTEHLLLALSLDAQSGAFRLMQRMGANPDTVLADTLRALVPGTASRPDRPAFTPRARLAVELAHRASARIGVPCTGTEHLLIGLAAESEGIAAKALNKSGIIARVVESHVTAELDGKTPERP